MTTPLTIPDLYDLAEQARQFADAVAELAHFDHVGCAGAARRLAETAHARLSASLSAVADQAIYDATRTETQPVIAARLGVTRSAVENSITRHQKRVAGVPLARRKKKDTDTA
jgi:tagatose-1,6-bisphosphate aldolase non-catalytic subunit AgaZ/GatZ